MDILISLLVLEEGGRVVGGRRGGRRATTVRAAGTVRRSEINLHPPRRGVARALRSSRRSRQRVRAHR